MSLMIFMSTIINGEFFLDVSSNGATISTDLRKELVQKDHKENFDL
jgi:hypothetical protein